MVWDIDPMGTSREELNNSIAASTAALAALGYLQGNKLPELKFRQSGSFEDNNFIIETNIPVPFFSSKSCLHIDIRFGELFIVGGTDSRGDMDQLRLPVTETGIFETVTAFVERHAANAWPAPASGKPIKRAPVEPMNEQMTAIFDSLRNKANRPKR